MKSLSQLVQHEFDCRFAWGTLVKPRSRLKRLIKRVEDSMKPRRSLGQNLFGSILDEAWPTSNAMRVYNQVNAKIHGRIGKVPNVSGAYSGMAAGSLFFVNAKVGSPMTPSQRALARAQQAAHRTKVADHPTFDEAASALARHFPLEALSLIH